jgi:hypothetical protein
MKAEGAWLPEIAKPLLKDRGLQKTNNRSNGDLTLSSPLRRHELSSSGEYPKRFIPGLMYVEKGKGE